MCVSPFQGGHIGRVISQTVTGNDYSVRFPVLGRPNRTCVISQSSCIITMILNTSYSINRLSITLPVRDMLQGRRCNKHSIHHRNWFYDIRSATCLTYYIIQCNASFNCRYLQIIADLFTCRSHNIRIACSTESRKC